MTTNESFFFRDKSPFEHFTDTMLPALLPARREKRRMRIWCAAASTGQEPYSLAMCLKEAGLKVAGYTIDILGTDISREVVDRAIDGTYTQFEVQRGLPVQLLLKYFTQNGESWQLKPAIREMVSFRTGNLLEPIASLGQFDIIFCRNVLIYFDQATKVDVLSRLARQLAPDGYLVLGAAETVIGLTDALVPVPGKRGLYQRNPAAKAMPAAPKRLVGSAA